MSHFFSKYLNIPLSLMMMIVLCACANSTQKGAVSHYSGTATVLSILEIDSQYQEIGLKLPDGRTTSIKTDASKPVLPDQQITIKRNANGTGTIL